MLKKKTKNYLFIFLEKNCHQLLKFPHSEEKFSKLGSKNFWCKIFFKINAGKSFFLKNCQKKKRFQEKVTKQFFEQNHSKVFHKMSYEKIVTFHFIKFSQSLFYFYFSKNFIFSKC